MSAPGGDAGILARITELVEREQRLRDDGIDPAERAQLHDVETQLDQCWDLLRQRRGKRHAGADPDDAAVRDEGTVEGYLQ